MRLETFVVFFIDKNTRFSLPAASQGVILPFNNKGFPRTLVLSSVV